MDENPTTTSSVPPHLLKDAYLVGKVPFRACRLDPRVSYGLYIPERKYCDFQVALQSGSDASSLRLPTVVNVHGTRHDASPHRECLIDFADKHGVAVLAPFFPAALDGPMDLDSYKVLRSKTLRSDVVLLSILEEIATIWPGIKTDRFTLLGFSGGGQFVHRFMYLHPERLSAAVVGAPGRVTKLTSDPWPKGVGDVGEIFDGREICLDAIRRVEHVLLVVGEKDNDMSKIQEVKKWVLSQERARSSSASTGGLGGDWSVGRLQKLRELQQHWKENGIHCDLEVVPDAGHVTQKVLPTIIRWLEENVEYQRN